MNPNLGKINIKSQSSRANESPTNANYRGAGLSEMAYAIENNLEHRCNGELSLHVLDIIDSTMRASQTGIPQEIKTTCKKPKPFTLEEIKNSRLLFKGEYKPPSLLQANILILAVFKF